MTTIILDAASFFLYGIAFLLLIARPYRAALIKKSPQFIVLDLAYLAVLSAGAAHLSSVFCLNGFGTYFAGLIMLGEILLVKAYTGEPFSGLLKNAAVSSATAVFSMSFSFLLCALLRGTSIGGVFPYFYPVVYLPVAFFSVLVHFRFTADSGFRPIPGTPFGTSAVLVPFALLFIVAATPAVCGNLTHALIFGGAICLVAEAVNLFVSMMWDTLFDRLRGAEATQAKAEELLRVSDIQAEHYKYLGEQFAAARSARHDIRHHISALEQYLKDGDRRRIEEYLSIYKASIPAADSLTLCSNLALDSVVQHYLNIAAGEGIQIDAVMDVGENVGIPDPDLCVIMGNCLENALEAVRTAPADMRFIRIRSEDSPGRLTIVVGNGFSGRLVEKDGLFLSSKRKGGLGVGLSSIRAVAEKYDGAAKFEAEGNLFKTSVILFKEVRT